MRKPATALSALAFLWALAATVYVLTGVGFDGISTTFALTGVEGEVGHVGVSLLSDRGVWVVGLLAGVILLAGMPFGVALSYPEGQRVATWIAGALLFGFSAMAVSTVGLFYVPCVTALLAAATATDVRGRGRRSDSDRRHSTV